MHVLAYNTSVILISTNETSTNWMSGAIQKECSYWITLSIQIELVMLPVFRRQIPSIYTLLLKMFDNQFQSNVMIERAGGHSG